MMFRAIEQTALKYPGLLAANGETTMQEIKSAKWLVWHGKAPKAVSAPQEPSRCVRAAGRGPVLDS
jgi:hypothetical protein